MTTYAELCRSKGVALDAMGSAGFALDRMTVLEALDLLASVTSVVLGGDVVRLTSTGPKYTYDSWHFDPMPRSTRADASAESVARAREYVRRYPDPDDGTVLYSLVVDD